jgi:hypothetical protein
MKEFELHRGTTRRSEDRVSHMLFPFSILLFRRLLYGQQTELSIQTYRMS